MTRHDGLARLAASLREAFGELSAAGHVDLVPLDEEEAFEVQSDHWTLYLRGWPLAEAWIALDDEGASDDEHLIAVQHAFGSRELAAFHALDHALAGRFIAALAASPDPLSATLARVLGRRR